MQPGRQILYCLIVYLNITPVASEDIESDLLVAQQAIQEAQQLGHVWRDTRAIYRQAIDANSQGDKKQARQLAKTALNQAQMAINQVWLERAKYNLSRYRERFDTHEEMPVVYQQVVNAINELKGKRAFSLMGELEATVEK